MKALHVLMLLGSSFPAPTGGGAEGQVRTLSKALRARGQRVTVLTPRTDTGVQKRVDRIDGIPVCRLPYPRLRLIGGLWLYVRLAMFLLSRRRRYDAWHVHIANRFGAVAALLGGWLGRPAIVKVAGPNEIERGPLAPNAPSLARFTYHCLCRAYAWQAISKRIAAVLAEKGVSQDRIAEIPNAVDTTRFRDISRDSASGLRFLFIGRLAPQKNLHTLLDAFAGMLHSHPDARLRIAGTGAMKSALKRHACALGINSYVEFTGHRNDIETLMAEADYGVLPSRIEGLSNSLLECMASGLPMIASRVSGNEDIVRNGENGWLFDPHDCAGLIACMTEAAMLTPDRRRAMGDNARITVERHAGLDSVIDRLLALYRDSTASEVPSLPASRDSA